MLKTGFTKLVASVIIAIVLFVCSACNEAPSLQLKVAADPVTNTSVTTTSDITTPAPAVVSAPFIPQFDISNAKITEAQAIAIASQYVPAEVASHAGITAGLGGSGNLKTGESQFYWTVAFMNISITKTWLGWQPDSQTTLSPDDTYNELTVNIDAVNGEYISRMAYIVVFIGGPGMTPPDIIPWVPSSTITTTPIR
jgi:hypothetical protein